MGNFGSLTDSTVVNGIKFAERERTKPSSGGAEAHSEGTAPDNGKTMDASTPAPGWHPPLVYQAAKAPVMGADSKSEEQQQHGADPNVSGTSQKYKPDPRLNLSLDERLKEAKDATDIVVSQGEGLRTPQRSAAVFELQEKMAALNRDLVLQTVREEYQGRSEERIVATAFDGKYGPAVAATVERMRVEVGLPAEGGVTKEFLDKLDAAIVIKQSQAPGADKSEAASPDEQKKAAEKAHADEIKHLSDEIERCIDNGKTKDGRTLEQVITEIRENRGQDGFKEVVLRYAGEKSDDKTEESLKRLLRDISQSRNLTPEDMAGGIAALLPTTGINQADLITASRLQIAMNKARFDEMWNDSDINPLVKECYDKNGGLNGAGQAFAYLLGGRWKDKFGGQEKAAGDPEAFLDFYLKKEGKYVRSRDSRYNEGATP